MATGKMKTFLNFNRKKKVDIIISHNYYPYLHDCFILDDGPYFNTHNLIQK